MMGDSVLVMSIGPVQEFIAQARRSRDLWFGSHALSEISRAAARAAAGRPGVKLVFPPVDSAADPLLEPCAGVFTGSGRPPINVGNHLLAIVPSSDVAAVAAAMKAEAVRRWEGLAADARRAAERHGLLADGIDDCWDDQVGSLLEIAAAAAAIDAAGGYGPARRAAEAALAGRKNLREFRQWADRRGAPKSSFDGGRVSVLRDAADRPARAAAAVRLGRNEQLDAVAVVKRLGGEPRQFVPLANVALADWIAHARGKAAAELAAAARACRDAGIGEVRRPDLPWVAWTDDGAAYDADALLEGRLGSLFEELDPGETDTAQGRRRIEDRCRDWRRDVLAPLFKLAGRPPEPYVCCIVADGDAMGRAIGDLDDLADPAAHPAAHRTLSASLAAFASDAMMLIAGRRGLPIYAGGDDVLGFASPSAALEVAGALRDAFATAVDETRVPFRMDRPTLSVGVGVGHVMDGMAHLLALARRAEKLAKGADTDRPRDALGVIADKRSGAEISWRGRWEDGPVGLLESLALALETRRLPAGKVHEVRTMLLRLPRPDQAAGHDEVLRGEVTRILRRAAGGSGRAPSLDEIGLRLPPPTAGYAALHAAVARWVDACLAARAFVSERGGHS